MRNRRLNVERLEPRLVLDATGLLPTIESLTAQTPDVQMEPVSEVVYHPMIVAGNPRWKGESPNGPDSPLKRVTEDFAAVGSLRVTLGRSTYLCTGTLIDSTHVLTAGHCVDIDSNGTIDVKPEAVTFYPDGDTSNPILATRLYIHPDFSGFSNSVNDDLAIVELTVAPNVDPIPVYEKPVGVGAQLRLVGFGESGSGATNYDRKSASWSVKREGGNVIDGVGNDDEGGLYPEIYYADFDPPSTYGMEGGSLGNEIETTLGAGDSGGPGLYDHEVLGITVAAVNTFVYGEKTDRGWVQPPKFGSKLAGILVYPYLTWIKGVLGVPDGDFSSDGSSGATGSSGSGDPTILKVNFEPGGALESFTLLHGSFTAMPRHGSPATWPAIDGSWTVDKSSLPSQNVQFIAAELASDAAARYLARDVDAVLADHGQLSDLDELLPDPLADEGLG